MISNIALHSSMNIYTRVQPFTNISFQLTYKKVNRKITNKSFKTANYKYT